MAYTAIVSDWSGTGIKYPTDEQLMKKIAYYALFEELKNVVLRGKLSHTAEIRRLLSARNTLKKAKREFERGEVSYKELVRAFNDFVIGGMHVSYVDNPVESYCQESAGLVDHNLLQPVQKAHDRGKKTAFLSSSYDKSIKRILELAEYADAFDVIVANSLVTDGDTIVGFTTNIYGKKAEVVQERFFRRNVLGEGLNERNTLYIGDSQDDEPVAEILAPGNFIVSLMATDEYREHMARKYKAQTPENREDVERLLAD